VTAQRVHPQGREGYTKDTRRMGISSEGFVFFVKPLVFFVTNLPLSEAKLQVGLAAFAAKNTRL
jgi:hypothetical protein